MAANASELYIEMRDAVESNRFLRTSSDAMSPQQDATIEAEPGRSFTLRNPHFNIADLRRPDMLWAAANVLHFFADTEDASELHRYNAHAERFAPGGVWKGAYGAIAMGQIRNCIDLLTLSPQSRRAIVSMGPYESDPDLNRPACISHLQFLSSRHGLDMVCYQRSLNLYSVFAYDCILLTNILRFVAQRTQLNVGSLHWSFGSLHMRLGMPHGPSGPRNLGLLLPSGVLADPQHCRELLATPTRIQELLS